MTRANITGTANGDSHCFWLRDQLLLNQSNDGLF